MGSVRVAEGSNAMRGISSLFLLLGLAACGDADAPVVKDPAVAPETGAAAQVLRLPEDQRAIVLQKAIRASGAPCPVVTGAEHIEVRKGAMGWRASCNDGTAHLIEIGADGTAQVTSRRD